MTRRKGGRNRRDANNDIVRLKRTREPIADARELEVDDGEERPPHTLYRLCARESGWRSR